MRALITGATGFVGSYLVRKLVKEKANVAILMRHNSNTWRIADILPYVKIIHGDLTDIKQSSKDIYSFKPEIIFHLAWYGVGNRYRNDPSQIQNLHGSLDLLTIAKELGCQSFVGLGSQAEYGCYSKTIMEDFPTQPTTLYGVTKLSVCLLAQKLSEIFGIRFVWLRLFSSYGPMDDPNWLISYIILSLLRGEKPSLTLGEQLWDYLYVEDAVEAIWRVAITHEAQGIFNLGSGEAHAVKNIVEKIRCLINPNLPLGFGEVPYRPDQIMLLLADISRLRQSTGWSPQINLDEGLKRTVGWFLKNREHYER
jgi:UDP-glucose 4-epimerase